MGRGGLPHRVSGPLASGKIFVSGLGSSVLEVEKVLGKGGGTPKGRKLRGTKAYDSEEYQSQSMKLGLFRKKRGKEKVREPAYLNTSFEHPLVLQGLMNSRTYWRWWGTLKTQGPWRDLSSGDRRETGWTVRY